MPSFTFSKYLYFQCMTSVFLSFFNNVIFTVHLSFKKTKNKKTKVYKFWRIHKSCSHCHIQYAECFIIKNISSCTSCLHLQVLEDTGPFPFLQVLPFSICFCHLSIKLNHTECILSNLLALLEYNGQFIVQEFSVMILFTYALLKRLRLATPKAGSVSLIRGGRTKIPLAAWCSQKQKEKEQREKKSRVQYGLINYSQPT